MHYSKAKFADIASMQKLVQPEVDKGVILHRSADEIATNIRSYMLAKKDNQLKGFVALHFHSFKLAEVRSLIVDSSTRGQGVGQALVSSLIEEGREYGVEQIFTLTYQKNFFEKLGFKEIEKASLPSQKIWADCIKCKHFPVCDEIALIKNI